eukprot:TRINITY_DN54899_c0_g1_i1.p1 TRINITY_DN54899_c0_g1~~TRINITY_DN54899_c0_g1_i1.p1  ORF type:complete len:392 (-),score=51.20 TRINITY_DN54899_c0_g1_i1:176-1267(-)
MASSLVRRFSSSRTVFSRQCDTYADTYAKTLLASWEISDTCRIDIRRIEGSIAHRPPTEFNDLLNFGGKRILVNSANEGLVGIQYGTFRKGGYRTPVPFRSPQTVLNWCRSEGVSGGDSVSDLYSWQSQLRKPVSATQESGVPFCLDRDVHTASGEELLTFLRTNFPVRSEYPGGHKVRMSVGQACTSPVFGDLRSLYEGLVHTVAPFCSWDYSMEGAYIGQEPNQGLSAAKLLGSCYTNSLKEVQQMLSHEVLPGESRRAADVQNSVDVYMPFLGTGVRGFPFDVSARMAAVGIARFFAEVEGARATNSAIEAIPSDFTIHMCLAGPAPPTLEEASLIIREFGSQLKEDGSCDGERRWTRIF